MDGVARQELEKKDESKELKEEKTGKAIKETLHSVDMGKRRRTYNSKHGKENSCEKWRRKILLSRHWKSKWSKKCLGREIFNSGIPWSLGIKNNRRKKTNKRKT